MPPRHEHRDRSIEVRLTASERTALDQAAVIRGLTASALVRDALRQVAVLPPADRTRTPGRRL